MSRSNPIHVNGQAIYYQTGDVPPEPGLANLVFLHGAAMDHTCWTLYARYHARNGYNVYALDLPGHNRSDGPAHDSVEALSVWLLQTLDALGIERAGLIGHSLGGLVALETATRAPTRCAHLTMLGAALPMPVEANFLELAHQNSPEAIDRLLLYGFDYASQLGGNPVSGISAINLAKRTVERAAAGVLYAGLKACNAYQPAPTLLDHLSCPTTLIVGTDESMVPCARACKFAASLPDASVLQIAGAGHMALMTHPEEVHQHLLSALSDTSDS